jgi:hypothetical protein
MWYHTGTILPSCTVSQSKKKAIFLVSTENFKLKNFMHSMWIELLHCTLLM